ncbi:uncharacterized protein HGUI_02499 [Hanseniaspora guilliermondii]|uniref:Uncharacterized protein n=1 Tax=Hanseniaspora guilliermondii TaxID=56406 RepID=A0A1L0B5G9_9ASCO|nr:uncharacterized protein HGUI_02499 [Hanseniaspora guilliermondii]
MIGKLKESKNRVIAFVYIFTGLLFTISIKLAYYSFNKYIEIRDGQDSQITTQRSLKRSNLVVTKIIYEDPLLMTLLFQISLIILFPIVQVYFFFRYNITPKHQISNAMNLHKDHHGLLNFDNKTSSEKINKSESVPRASLEMSKKSLDMGAPIMEENEEVDDFDINDLQPFPQSNKIPDYKRSINHSRGNSLTNINYMNSNGSMMRRNTSLDLQNMNNKGLSVNSDIYTLMKIFKSLKPVESFFFGMALNVILYSIFKSISLIPFLDFMLMFNLSSFEILSLLLSCLNMTFFKIEDIFEMHKKGISNEKKIGSLFKAFVGMLISVTGCFLAASERKGTVLASTATTNIDPFIFNRLGGCLILGLVTLVIGPLVIVWNSKIMEYLYDLVYCNHSNNNHKNLYRVFSNSAMYSSFRSRRNTLSMELESINENNESTGDDMEQDLTEKELTIQFQSLLTFQVAFIATISFLTLVLVNAFMPENIILTNVKGKRDTESILILKDNYTVQTLGVDTALLTNMLIIVPLFLIGLIYLSKRVKFGVLITLPMTIVFLAFVVENIFPSGGNGTTLSAGDTYTTGETLGYIIAGLGSLWGLAVYQ